MAGWRRQREPQQSPPTPTPTPTLTRNPEPTGAIGAIGATGRIGTTGATGRTGTTAMTGATGPAVDGARVSTGPETTIGPATALSWRAAQGAHPRRPLSSAEVLDLQRTVGNAAVVRLLNDPVPDTGNQAQAPDPRDLLRLPGRPLAGSTLADMEDRFGADFSDVRLHTGPAARRSADALGARAYTSGSHVVIGDGGADRATLAHELTHVLQQRGGPVAGTEVGGGLRVSDPADEFERAATRTAALVLGRQPAQEPGRERPVHPALGEANVPAAPAPAAATLQRVLVAQVDSDDGQRISSLTIAGRPESPYKGTMGDHSTAFAVQVDAVRRCVVGRAPARAADELEFLYLKTLNLPGVRLFRGARLRDSAQHHRFEAACRAFESRHEAFAQQPESHKILELQLLVNDFLSARELVPLTTINVKSHYPALAGKGHGESRPHEALFSHTNGSKLPTSKDLQDAVCKLLDSQGVALVATEADPDILAEMAPGLSKDLSCDQRVAILVEQHLGSIELAYPGVVNEAWGGVDAAAKALTAEMQTPVKLRRAANVAVYLKKLGAARDRIANYLSQRSQESRGSGRYDYLTALLASEGTDWDGLAKVVRANGGEPLKKPSLTTFAPLETPRNRRPTRPFEFAATNKRKRGAVEPAGAASATKGPGPKKRKHDDADTVSPGKQAANKRKREDIEAVGAVSAPGKPASAKGKERMRQGEDEEEQKSAGQADAAPVEVDEEEETERKQSLAIQIILDAAGRIAELRSAGRSRSPHPGTMGAHTTAWAVYIDVIRRRVEGRTITAAVREIAILAQEAQSMSENLKRAGYEGDSAQKASLAGSKADLVADLGLLRAAVPMSARQPLLLQRCVNDLLTMVNFIPGVSLDSADTGGKGEGTIRQRLLRYERGDNPYGAGDRRRLLMNDLLGMLDIRAESGKAKREALVENHVHLIARAYPKATKDSGLRLVSAAEILDERRNTAPFKRGSKRARTEF